MLRPCSLAVRLGVTLPGRLARRPGLDLRPHYDPPDLPRPPPPPPPLAAGVYDHAPGDVPRIAALPAWSEIDVSDGGGWLNETRPDTSALQNYRSEERRV